MSKILRKTESKNIHSALGIHIICSSLLKYGSWLSCSSPTVGCLDVAHGNSVILLGFGVLLWVSFFQIKQDVCPSDFSASLSSSP